MSLKRLCIPPQTTPTTRTVTILLPRCSSVLRRFVRHNTFHTHTTGLRQKQHCLPAAYYRGGTSRAVFFKLSDLPRDRSQWPAIFRGVVGSPDSDNGRQLDGLGGGVSSLSKVCVVGAPSERPDDADVDYTFAAVGVRDSEVDFSSNCGNMTSAVGPFAVDQGMVKVPTTKSDGSGGDGGGDKGNEALVRIHNTNTGKIIHARFPVEDGVAISYGDFAIDGVAGTAAKIELAFIDPAGSKTGKLLPTGNITDTFENIQATCIDVGNPCVFVEASSLKVDGGILPDAMESHPNLLETLDLIRRKAAVAMGISKTEASCPGSIPKIALVSSPHSHLLSSGKVIPSDGADVIARAISVGQPHRALPITVAMALAAASKMKGSVVYKNTSETSVDPDGVTIGHSSGTLLVTAKFKLEDEGGEIVIENASVFRTARRLMQGTVFWK